MDDTHATPNPMPKVQYTIVRNGIYNFNARYPQDLIEAGLVDSPSKRKSLGTRDWREAKRLANLERALFDSEVESLLAKLPKKRNSHTSANASEIKLSNLTKRQQRNLILKAFVEWEENEEKLRNRISLADEDQKLLLQQIALEDLAAYESADSFGSYNWDDDIADFLKDQRIESELDDVSDEFRSLFRRARIEVQYRTVAAFKSTAFSGKDPVFADLHVCSEVSADVTPSHTVAEICEKFPNRMAEGKLRPGTIAAYEQPLRLIQEFFSPDKQLSEIRYSDAESLVRFLAEIPTNAKKRYRGLSTIKASKLEKKSSEPKFISPKRQEILFQTIRAVFRHAAEIEWIEKNPFASAGLVKLLPEAVRRDRAQFTAEDLKKLFSHPDFLNEKGKKSESGRSAESRFWVPLLCMYHGGRANEYASLYISDVKEEGGIHFFDITRTDDFGKIVKSLKTEASVRRVPIHKTLIEFGFLESAQARRFGWLAVP